jgi:hypothetical protein
MYDYELGPEFRLLEQLTVGFSAGMGQISLQHPRDAALMPQLQWRAVSTGSTTRRNLCA